MATHAEAHARVEHYLISLRSALGRMPDGEKAEIVSDLRNHLEERLAGGGPPEAIVAETLVALGSPEELGASFRRERLLARAATAAGPVRLLEATFQWALTGLRGFAAFLALLIGYSFGLGLIACAALKPFLPHRVGLWADPPWFTLGFLALGKHTGPERLGWWIMPLGFTLGSLLLVGTTRLVQSLLLRRAMAEKGK